MFGESALEDFGHYEADACSLVERITVRKPSRHYGRHWQSRGRRNPLCTAQRLPLAAPSRPTHPGLSDITKTAKSRNPSRRPPTLRISLVPPRRASTRLLARAHRSVFQLVNRAIHPGLQQARRAIPETHGGANTPPFGRMQHHAGPRD